MTAFERFIDLFDARPLIKRSRLRIGAIDARGVPAVLIGVSAIVAAAGTARVLHKTAAVLPEALRETRQLLLAVRPPAPMLESS